jgi:hypothetical protein
MIQNDLSRNDNPVPRDGNCRRQGRQSPDCGKMAKPLQLSHPDPPYPAISLLTESETDEYLMKSVQLSWQDGLLMATVPDSKTVSVKPVLILPVQDPQGPVSLVDEEKKEVYLILDRSELDPVSQKVLEESIARRHLWSVITAVLSAEVDHGIRRILVETDRGQRSILLSDPDKHLRECEDGDRLILDDLAGSRFVIPSRKSLDARSQALLADVL